MTTREHLHKLIDELPDCDLGTVQLLIEWRYRLPDDCMGPPSRARAGGR